MCVCVSACTCKCFLSEPMHACVFLQTEITFDLTVQHWPWTHNQVEKRDKYCNESNFKVHSYWLWIIHPQQSQLMPTYTSRLFLTISLSSVAFTMTSITSPGFNCKYLFPHFLLANVGAIVTSYNTWISPSNWQWKMSTVLLQITYNINLIT